MAEHHSVTRPITQITTATTTKVVTPTQDSRLPVSQAASPNSATVAAIQHAAQYRNSPNCGAMAGPILLYRACARATPAYSPAAMNNALNSLGFAKPPKETRVVAAMSGGVDSSVVAGLLAREGYDVVGVTLQLYDHGAATRKKGACCAGQDIHDAKRVAERLGIAHYVLDYEERFRRQVMQDFADSYARGQTPIPCIRCNERVKFGDLLTLARELGADALATGHYVRRVSGASGPELHRALDDSRDQSYFLFATTREQLAMLRFPLGQMSKVKVRDIATELGLAVADKPDSQDICFVPQ